MGGEGARGCGSCGTRAPIHGRPPQATCPGKQRPTERWMQEGAAAAAAADVRQPHTRRPSVRSSGGWVGRGLAPPDPSGRPSPTFPRPPIHPLARRTPRRTLVFHPPTHPPTHTHTHTPTCHEHSDCGGGAPWMPYTPRLAACLPSVALDAALMEPGKGAGAGGGVGWGGWVCGLWVGGWWGWGWGWGWGGGGPRGGGQGGGAKGGLAAFQAARRQQRTALVPCWRLERVASGGTVCCQRSSGAGEVCEGWPPHLQGTKQGGTSRVAQTGRQVTLVKSHGTGRVPLPRSVSTARVPAGRNLRQRGRRGHVSTAGHASACCARRSTQHAQHGMARRSTRPCRRPLQASGAHTPLAEKAARSVPVVAASAGSWPTAGKASAVYRGTEARPPPSGRTLSLRGGGEGMVRWNALLATHRAHPFVLTRHAAAGCWTADRELHAVLSPSGQAATGPHAH